MYNLFVACDQLYYQDWCITFLKTLRHHVPWLKLHCHLVNADSVEKLPYVDYTHEHVEYVNDDQKLGYLQAVRFLAVANKFKNNERVIVLDCDSLCVRPFSPEEFAKLFEQQYVLRNTKIDRRWMAGFVTFKDNHFRQAYAEKLLEKPINEWLPGWDQDVMKEICETYHFVELSKDWITVGKHNGRSAFFTSKGSQKFKEKYLERYRYFVERDLNANIIPVG